jgi:O-antigen/teichoic acid export membrane protein
MKEITSSRMRLWSLVEQGFLSLANFGMAIFLARELPKEGWGAFSLGFALLLFAQGFQRALVSIPVATMARDLELLSKSLRFWRRLQGKITFCAAGALTSAAAIFFLCRTDRSIALSLAVAALMVPG